MYQSYVSSLPGTSTHVFDPQPYLLLYRLSKYENGFAIFIVMQHL